MHVDSDEEVDGRRVTAICYLNAHWWPGDGGEVHARRPSDTSNRSNGTDINSFPPSHPSTGKGSSRL